MWGGSVCAVDTRRPDSVDEGCRFNKFYSQFRRDDVRQMHSVLFSISVKMLDTI